MGEDLAPVGGSVIETKLNPAIKEKLFAKEVQVIVILCSSPGAIAELAIISQHSELACKTIIAMESIHQTGFVAKGPLKEAQNYGAKLISYKPDDLVAGKLETQLEEAVLARIEVAIARRLRASDS